MRILSWNVNGLRAVMKKDFNKWFNKERPDILCLQETKAFPEQIVETPLMASLRKMEYHDYWNNPPRKGYAGVAVFSREKPVSVSMDFSKKFDTEGRAIILSYKNFILINVYFPNGGMSDERLRYKLKFYDVFLDYLDGLKGKNVVVCGDVNTAHMEIDLARPKENSMITGFLPEERAWIDKLIDHGYVDTFRLFNKEGKNYSWWDYKTKARERNVGWRIDYFFVSEKFSKNIKDAFIMPEVTGSDHCPVGIELAI